MAFSYDGLAGDYAHQVVDHAVEYVAGRTHTKGQKIAFNDRQGGLLLWKQYAGLDCKLNLLALLSGSWSRSLKRSQISISFCIKK